MMTNFIIGAILAVSAGGDLRHEKPVFAKPKA